MPAACCFLFHKQVIMGKRMKDWLRFSVCWWHTWRGRGADIFGLTGTHQRPWDGESLEAYLTRVDVHFEFCQALSPHTYTTDTCHISHPTASSPHILLLQILATFLTLQHHRSTRIFPPHLSPETRRGQLLLPRP